MVYDHRNRLTKKRQNTFLKTYFDMNEFELREKYLDEMIEDNILYFNPEKVKLEGDMNMGEVKSKFRSI